jgi:hypoxanthine phosphoribosyltransferase
MIRESGYHPDIIVAIGRGGYIPARLLCDHLDMMALTGIKIEHYLAGTSRQKQAIIRYPLCTDIRDQQVLVVDDVNDSGDTIELAIQHLQTFQPREIRTAVMHHKAISNACVDYFAKKIIKWRWLIYPWAITEDISGFLESLSPETVEEAQQLLAEQFGIKIPSQRLKEIYALWKNRSGHS